MAKQPFTEAGVQQKMAELYALNNTALSAEAASAKNDFKTWLSNNFSFDSGQANFLANLTDEWLTAAGGQLNVALQYRLDVSIVIGTPPNPDLPPWVQGKWINYHEVPIFTDNSGTSTATGSLRFEIGYSG